MSVLHTNKHMFYSTWRARTRLFFFYGCSDQERHADGSVRRGRPGMILVRAAGGTPALQDGRVVPLRAPGGDDEGVVGRLLALEAGGDAGEATLAGEACARTLEGSLGRT